MDPVESCQSFGSYSLRKWTILPWGNTAFLFFYFKTVINLGFWKTTHQPLPFCPKWEVLWLLAKGSFSFLGGRDNAILPSWTLKLHPITESWGESKTDFKGEDEGFKIEEVEGINVPLSFCEKKKKRLLWRLT